MKTETAPNDKKAAAAGAEETAAKGQQTQGQAQTQQPEPKKKSEEDLKAIDEWTDSFFGSRKKKKDDKGSGTDKGEKGGKKDDKSGAKAGDDKKADDEKKPDGEDANKPKPAGDKKPKPQVRQPAAAQPPSAGDITKAVAEGVREGFKERQREEKKDQKDEPELQDSDKYKISVLEQMGKTDPQHKDLAKKYRDSVIAGRNYADAWEKKNPGKAFDPEDPEHDEFFEQHDVDWDDDAFRRAEVRLEAAALVKEQMQPVNEELDGLKRDRKLREQDGNIRETATNAARDFWKSFGDDFSKIIGEDGQVNAEEFKKLDDSDPLGLDIATQYATKVVQPIAAEIYKLSNGLVKFDPRNSRMHADIAEFATEEEQAVLEMPDKLVDSSGRKFATSAEWNKLSEAERKNRWYLDADRLTQLWAAKKAKEARELAKQKREEIQKYASKYPKTEDNKPKPNAGRQEEDDDETPQDSGKPSTPTVGAPPVVAGSKKKNEHPNEKAISDWVLGR